MDKPVENNKNSIKIEEITKIIKLEIVQNYDEFIVYLGLFFIILASFLVNKVLGFYILGAILTVLGIYLMVFPKKNNEKEVSK